MEKYKTLIQSANSHYKNADHMVFVTYSLVNDPKLVITIADRLYKALMDSVSALLNYEYLYKRIGRLPETDDEKLEILKNQAMKEYNLDRNMLVFI